MERVMREIGALQRRHVLWVFVAHAVLALCGSTVVQLSWTMTGIWRCSMDLMASPTERCSSAAGTLTASTILPRRARAACERP